MLTNFFMCSIVKNINYSLLIINCSLFFCAYRTNQCPISYCVELGVKCEYRMAL